MEKTKVEMRKRRKVFNICLLLLALLQITAPSSAEDSTNTTTPTPTTTTPTPTPTTTTSAPNPAALRYLTRPADLTVAVGDPAVFSCGVPSASPTFIFTFYGSHGNYSLTCPSGHVEDIPQALYGSCGSKKGESLAVWTLKGTSYSDNGTRVVCQQPNNPAAPAAVLHVYDDGRNYSILIGCAVGGFFGILLVFGLSYLMLRRSETLQTWFRGSQPEDDMNTIVTKE